MRFSCVILLILASAAPAAVKGPAIAVAPDDEPWVIKKLRVVDSRAVRGWVGAPVDGSSVRHTAELPAGGKPLNSNGKLEGWSVALDLEDAVAEIYEGNNRVTVGK